MLEGALALAHSVPSPNSLAFALVFSALLHQQLRQPDQTREAAEECLAICDEHGVPSERLWVTTAYGWSLAELGHVEEGLERLREALDAQRAGGGEIAGPQFISHLAAVQLHLGNAEEALKAVEDGLETSRRTGNAFYDAELWRQRGEVMKLQGDSAEAHRSFQTAIAVARRQSAKSLELRAATSLARLWREEGRSYEAHRLLQQVFGWFREGFDTADLRDAASLLEELTSSAGSGVGAAR